MINVTGRLTKDPILRTVQYNGAEHKVADITIAVNFYGPNSHKKYTTFYSTSAWDADAEAVMETLRKADKVEVEAPHLEAKPWCNAETAELGVILELRHSAIWLVEKYQPKAESNPAPQAKAEPIKLEPVPEEEVMSYADEDIPW